MAHGESECDGAAHKDEAVPAAFDESKGRMILDEEFLALLPGEARWCHVKFQDQAGAVMDGQSFVAMDDEHEDAASGMELVGGFEAHFSAPFRYKDVDLGDGKTANKPVEHYGTRAELVDYIREKATQWSYHRWVKDLINGSLRSTSRHSTDVPKFWFWRTMRRFVR